MVGVLMSCGPIICHATISTWGYQGGESVAMAYIADAVRNKNSGGSTALLCSACDVGHADADD